LGFNTDLYFDISEKWEGPPVLKYTLPSAHTKYAAPWTYLSGGRCSH